MLNSVKWYNLIYMKKVYIPAVLILLMCAGGGVLFAQSSAAEVIFGEGYGFSILREGKENYYDVLYDDVTGLELFEGDYISTDESTFIEIQLASSKNVLKISENTSFQITEVSEGGGGRFALTYGRVRAKVDRLVGNDQFTIGGPSAVAGVRGTDFGYDIIAKRDEAAEDFKTTAQVYCFQGKVEVVRVQEVETMEEIVVIETNEMVSFSSVPEAAPVKEEFVPREIEEEINIFWRQNDFEGVLIDYPAPEKEEVREEKEPEPVEKQPPPEEPEKTVEEEKVIITEAEKEKARKNFFAAGTTVVGIGVLTEVAGILLHFFGPTWFSGDPATYRDTGTVLMVAGGGIAVGGLLTYLGILVNR